MDSKKMKAYIQTKVNGDWLNENCYQSAEGFHRMGYDIVKFQIQDTLNTLTFNASIFNQFDIREDVVHGGIYAIRNLFDRFGVPQPPIHNPHDAPMDYYTGRTFCERKLKDVAMEFTMDSDIAPTPVFIKPLTEHKLFTGLVIRQFSDLIKINHVDGNTDILQSSVSNFISEYRVFINRQDIMGCKNYTGYYKVLPDFNLIEDAIRNYGHHPELPVSYSLDFAITDKGETQLIEINDGFALGSYGLNPIYYCKMIRDRWHQIINTKQLG